MTIPSSDGLFSAGSCLPCTPEEEKRIVDELEAAAVANRKEGDLYYIISARWWREWQNYVGLERFNESSSLSQNEGIPSVPCKPGQIDNTELIENKIDEEENESVISRDLMEGQDFTLVSQEVWNRLMEWYKGGPAIPRRLIANEGLRGKNWIVEVHPISLQLIDSRDDSRRVIRISRKESVRDLYNRVCTLLKLESSKVRIWDHLESKKQNELANFDQTIEKVLIMDQEILLEVLFDGPLPSADCRMDSTGNELALVPLEPSRTSITIAGGPTLSNGYSSGSNTDSVHANGLYATAKDADDNGAKVEDKGLTGLHNLGNTCFMNSAIQCLVHTPPLVEYFLKDYGEEINEDNPLGMRGELAVAFGDLLRKLWSSGRTPVAPRAFKAKLALFAPQFSGYNQHDSQELLAFLLDGLHEDLNRVKCKPYIEAKDADSCPDEDFAQECWENHKARNDSIIVDICQGQYKSTLVCPVCSKVSVTFDPFMYLSLPLPSTATRTMTITVFSGNGSALPMPYTVTVPKHGCIKDLNQALSISCCLKSDEAILLAEVYEHRIYRYFENPSEMLSSIKDEEHVVAYILPQKHEKLLRLEIMHQNKEKYTSVHQSNIFRKLVGTPLVTCLGEGPHGRAKYQAAVEAVLKPLMRRKTFPSDQAKNNEQNGSSPDLDGISLEDGHHPCPSDEDMPLSNTAQEEDGDPVLQLTLTDEKASSSTPIPNDSGFFHGSCTRVLLDWSEKEYYSYDTSFLNDLPEVYKPGFSVKKTKQEAISLFSCLDAFLKEEPLGPDDMWYCPSCKEHRQATKKLDLWKLPDILVIHLKRFSYSRYLKNKLDTFVNFPIHNLDLGKYLKHRMTTGEPFIYELYAVSNHYGGLGGGHYSAYAKLVNENSWYHFDDSHVSPVNEESIRTAAAYVLFYRRVKVDSQVNGWDSSPVSSCG